MATTRTLRPTAASAASASSRLEPDHVRHGRRAPGPCSPRASPSTRAAARAAGRGTGRRPCPARRPRRRPRSTVGAKPGLRSAPPRPRPRVLAGARPGPPSSSTPLLTHERDRRCRGAAPRRAPGRCRTTVPDGGVAERLVLTSPARSPTSSSDRGRPAATVAPTTSAGTAAPVRALATGRSVTVPPSRTRPSGRGPGRRPARPARPRCRPPGSVDGEARPPPSALLGVGERQRQHGRRRAVNRPAPRYQPPPPASRPSSARPGRATARAAGAARRPRRPARPAGRPASGGGPAAGTGSGPARVRRAAAGRGRRRRGRRARARSSARNAPASAGRRRGVAPGRAHDEVVQRRRDARRRPRRAAGRPRGRAGRPPCIGLSAAYGGAPVSSSHSRMPAA